jgi:hypothetical protein
MTDAPVKRVLQRDLISPTALKSGHAAIAMATKRHGSLILSLKSEAVDLGAAMGRRAFFLHPADLLSRITAIRISAPHSILRDEGIHFNQHSRL